MSAKQYLIALSAEERAVLGQVARSTREKRRARILLESDIHVPREEGVRKLTWPWLSAIR